jgi:hypothetical protein
MEQLQPLQLSMFDAGCEPWVPTDQLRYSALQGRHQHSCRIILSLTFQLDQSIGPAGAAKTGLNYPLAGASAERVDHLPGKFRNGSVVAPPLRGRGHIASTVGFPFLRAWPCRLAPMQPTTPVRNGRQFAHSAASGVCAAPRTGLRQWERSSPVREAMYSVVPNPSGNPLPLPIACDTVP